jgi:hypothetical protein
MLFADATASQFVLAPPGELAFVSVETLTQRD